MKWTKTMMAFFCSEVRKGYTDRVMVTIMKKKYPGKWTVHSMRSQRGRLERNGILRRGLSGSSLKRRKRDKKDLKVSTTTIPERALRFLNLYAATPEDICRALQKAQKTFGDMPKMDHIYDPPRRVDRVWLMAKNGTNLQFAVPESVFEVVCAMCFKAALGLPIRSVSVANELVMKAKESSAAG